MAHAGATVLKPSVKPSIVLVHGFRGSPLGLEAIAQILRQAGYQVHIPAIPPFAGAGELSSYQAKDYADFLARYIRDQNLSRPILIGHSMGSIVVSATAKFYPQLINHKLVLLSPISTKTAKPFALISPLAAIVPRRIVDYITTRYLLYPKTGSCSAILSRLHMPVAKIAHLLVAPLLLPQNSPPTILSMIFRPSRKLY